MNCEQDYIAYQEICEWEDNEEALLIENSLKGDYHENSDSDVFRFLQ